MTDDDNFSDASGLKKRETLAERFKRIIGVSFEEISAATSNRESPGAETTPPPGIERRTKSPNRRRNQILHAQRSHRQRTQLYIRELEKEVLRLRASEASARALAAKRQEKNLILISTLRENNVENPLPVEHEYSSQSSDSSGRSADSPHDGDNQADTVTVDLTALATVEPDNSCAVKAAYGDRPSYSPSLGNGDMHFAFDAMQSNVAKLDSQAGIDFVLSLERPCLAHVHNAYISQADLEPERYIQLNSGPGHIFNASSALVKSPYSLDPTTTPFEVPTADIEQLLATSHNLGLSENEITPVQIWATLREISATTVVTQEALNFLTSDLARYSRCNGFGTVVDKSVVDAVFALFFNVTTF